MALENIASSGALWGVETVHGRVLIDGSILDNLSLEELAKKRCNDSVTTVVFDFTALEI